MLSNMSLLSVVSYNIQYSLGADNRYDLARAIEPIRKADIICLQEIDRNWRRTNMADQFAEIQQLLPDRYCVFGPSIDVDASAIGADGTVINRRRQGGQMIASRYPIVSSRVIHMPKDDTGINMNMWSVALEAVIATPEKQIRVINLHLTDVTETNRITQIESLLKQCAVATIEGGAWNGDEGDDEYREHWQMNDTVPQMPKEIILTGDFNDEPESHVIKLVANAGFRDTWSLSPATAGSTATFKKNPEQGTDRDLRIDFVFVSPHFETVAAYIDGTTDASDHQPVWATLR
jgi:endonuclease/exonuclease/phosphatase family metal-dependent hydrolase